jgi:hypothetical protein
LLGWPSWKSSVPIRVSTLSDVVTDDGTPESNWAVVGYVAPPVLTLVAIASATDVLIVRFVRFTFTFLSVS